MSLLIGFLTFVLVMNCLFLMLLILIQLPKKEAGAGIAFGGAAADALFGAGSGNALTKVTKYSATVFMGLSVVLSMLNLQAYHASSRRLEQELSRPTAGPAPSIPALPRTAPNLVPTNVPASPAVSSTPTVSTGNLLTPEVGNGGTPPANPAPTSTAPAAAPGNSAGPAGNPNSTAPANTPGK